MAKLVMLTQGQFAIVDDEDYDRVAQFKWYAHKTKDKYYAARRKRNYKGSRHTEFLHHFIMQPSPNQQVDHIDGDRLNCTRANMRFSTQAQNVMNTAKRNDNTSGYKGVSWSKRHQKWCASITAQGRHIYLGLFIDPADAARAYDAAACEYFGEYARTNFTVEIPSTDVSS